MKLSDYWFYRISTSCIFALCTFGLVWLSECAIEYFGRQLVDSEVFVLWAFVSWLSYLFLFLPYDRK